MDAIQRTSLITRRFIVSINQYMSYSTHVTMIKLSLSGLNPNLIYFTTFVVFIHNPCLNKYHLIWILDWYEKIKQNYIIIYYPGIALFR